MGEKQTKMSPKFKLGVKKTWGWVSILKNHHSNSFNFKHNLISILNEYLTSCHASFDSSFEHLQGWVLLKMVQNVFKIAKNGSQTTKNV